MSIWGRLFLIFSVAILSFITGYSFREIVRGEGPHNLGTLAEAIGLRNEEPGSLKPSTAFVTALGRIEAEFYGTPDRQKLIFAAANGMLAALNDPYTLLLEAKEAELFDERNRGRFTNSGGIGAELSPHELGARVERVFKNSPASKAGLKPNDLVVKVNGEDVAGDAVETIVERIRGQEGTKVQITIFRPSEKKTKTFSLTRRRVSIQDVYGDVIFVDSKNGKVPIGLMQVRMFSETMVRQFDEEYDALEAKKIKGLIIDLRHNPGGLMDSAVDLAGRFLSGKLVATMKRRNSAPETYFTKRSFARKRDYPVVILVDDTTASAAEIFAGALQDYKVATLVGEHTFGKASVQTMVPLRNGAELKITIGKYYLPSNKPIARVEDENGRYVSGGIWPDVQVKLSPNAVPGDQKSDNQLQKAIKVILQKIDG
ncbi:MAG TPA: S41 family peptidase [Fimbriimonadales bacterium]|nr:S41 family peptidase [Fimbriimonadales bacterium]